MKNLPRWVFVVAGVASLSLIAGLLVSNFIGGETKIERRIERLYGLDDPPFHERTGRAAGSAVSDRKQDQRPAQGRSNLPADALAERARQGVKDLIAQLEGVEPNGDMYDANAKASSLDMSDLGARMAARKDELLAQAA